MSCNYSTPMMNQSVATPMASPMVQTISQPVVSPVVTSAGQNSWPSWDVMGFLKMIGNIFIWIVVIIIVIALLGWLMGAINRRDSHTSMWKQQSYPSYSQHYDYDRSGFGCFM